jgi:hypothetical protein
MKRIIKRIVSFILLIALVTITGICTLIFFPQPLFAHKLEYQAVKVYSDTELVAGDWEPALKKAHDLVAASEIYDPHYQFTIFLAHGNIYNEVENILGRGPAARATAGNVVFKVPIDIKNDRTINEYNHPTFTQLLAHEMIHNLQAHHFGYSNFNPLNHPPLWKLEGYPEYVSRQGLLCSEDYSLGAEIIQFTERLAKSHDGIVEVTEGHYMPSYYYKGRLMVEYLMDRRGLSYADILEDKRSEEEIWNEMLDRCFNN